MRRVGVMLVAVVLAAAAGCAGTPGPPRLPNLRAQPPAELTVHARDGRVWLGFRSAAENVGAGPLIVEGRAGGTPGELAARQLADGADPRPLRGLLRYETSPDHAHFHYLGFLRYELRHPDGRLAGTGVKAGFCLGDRVDADPTRRLPAEPVLSAFTSNCGAGHPHLTSLREGISVGRADPYPPHLEGQHIDITALPAGRYRLVHTVNPDGDLAESDHTDNTAELEITLTWQGDTALVEPAASR